MANVKITELPQVSTILGTDIVPTVASSATSKITITDFANSLPQVSSSLSASYLSGSTAIVTDLTSSQDIRIRSNTSEPITIGRAYYSASNGNNLVFGWATLRSASSGANYNVAIGDFTLATLQSGTQNVAVGYGALYRTTANQNTAVGYLAAFNVTGSTGFRNNAFGWASLYSNTTGEVNSAFGSLALFANVIGSYNAGMGDFSLRYLATGSSNSALGQAAGFNLRSGEGNVFIGRGAAPSLLSGSNNTIIGGITPNADINTPIFGLLTGSYNTIIGSNIKYLQSTLDSNIILADGQGSIRAWHNSESWSFSGSVVANQGFTGSLFGTSSWATNAISSSYPIAVTGSTLYSTNPSAGNNFNTTQNIFLGEGSGQDSQYTTFAVSLGYQAGYQSNFSQSYTDDLGDFTASVNFIGYQAGYQATESIDANFIGFRAGYQSQTSNGANFIGDRAGYLSKNGDNSNFIGRNAGFVSDGVRYSNAIGRNAAEGSLNVIDSNIIGESAGENSKNIRYSNFIGPSAGTQASFCTASNFIGYYTGLDATSSYSTLIGWKAGSNTFSRDKSIGSNNIIIGTNITLEKDRKDSINLGGIIFGTGSYFPSSVPIYDDVYSGSVNGRIGINQPNPQFNFDVSGSGRFTNGLTVTGSVQISTVLTLPPQDPLPIGVPTGSFAVSGSGVDCKPYFWNGNSWTSLI